MVVELGSVGIWSGGLRRCDPAARLDAVAELDSLGYGALWMPGGDAAGYFEIAAGILAATRRIVVAPGILSVWTNPAESVAAAHAELSGRYPGRMMLGLGVSHPHHVEPLGLRFEHPVAVMTEYLDALSASTAPPARNELILAALGPRMLELSRDRAAGAHPYFVTPEHTRLARFVLGSGRLLVPEQAVVLETDPARARAISRRHMSTYLRAPNYTNNLLRLGFDAADFADPGSDRLVDAIVAWGDLEAISRRVDGHFAAGADHVCLQALPADPAALPLGEWRELAGLLSR